MEFIVIKGDKEIGVFYEYPEALLFAWQNDAYVMVCGAYLSR